MINYATLLISHEGNHRPSIHILQVHEIRAIRTSPALMVRQIQRRQGRSQTRARGVPDVFHRIRDACGEMQRVQSTNRYIFISRRGSCIAIM